MNGAGSTLPFSQKKKKKKKKLYIACNSKNLNLFIQITTKIMHSICLIGIWQLTNCGGFGYI